MQAHPISLKTITPGNVPAFALASNLQAAGSSPSEWYLYTYLLGAAHALQSNPFTVTVTDMRRGVEGVFEAIHMSRNTLISALDGLEKSGLVSVEREEEGVSVLLHITLL